MPRKTLLRLSKRFLLHRTINETLAITMTTPKGVKLKKIIYPDQANYNQDCYMISPDQIDYQQKRRNRKNKNSYAKVRRIHNQPINFFTVMNDET